jgi:hypothetical protein
LLTEIKHLPDILHHITFYRHCDLPVSFVTIPQFIQHFSEKCTIYASGTAGTAEMYGEL